MNSIRWKIAIPFVFLILIAFLTVGVVTVYLVSKTLTSRAQEASLLLAQTTSMHLGNLLEEKMKTVKGIANLDSLKRMNSEQMDKDIDNIRKYEKGFTSLIVIDLDGEIVSFVDKPHNLGKSLGMREYFQIARNQGRSNFSDSVLTLDKTVTVVAATPIINDSSQTVGVLTGTFDVNDKNFNQVILDTRIGQTGYAYLIDSRGILISHPDVEQALKQENLSHYSVIKKVLSGEKGVGTYNYEGIEMVAAYAPVPQSGWGVVVQQSTKEAGAPAEELGLYILILVFSCTAIALLLGIFISRRISIPLEKLKESAEKIGKGSLQENVPDLGKDEIGILAKTLDEMRIRLNESRVERNRIEEALRDSEKKYREVVENANEAIAIIQDGRILFINRKATEISGYSEEELMSRPFIEFVHPDEKQMVMQHHLKRLKGEEIPEVYELRILAKDGDVKWIENNGVIVSWEGKPATLNLLTDITKRKQAETALVIAKKQWEATFDAISDWVSIIDKNHNIIQSNNASKSLVDLTPKNVVGKHCHKIVHGRDCPIPDCPMELAVNSKQREDMEIQLENGRWVQISVDPIDNENKDEFFVHIVRDITDRKRVEVEKDKLEAQKRHIQKAESLTRMAGAIAHNFNNQLQVVTGNLGMAMRDQPGGSETLEEALKAAHKAADISALMLTCSGKQPGKHEPIDLSAACRQSLTLLQAAAPKDTMLKADLPASGPVIRCNAGHIQQVIINLATNAWESADESRGGIGLTVKTVSQKDIPAFKRFPAGWNPQESVYTCLEVVDAGCGIASKDIENLFDPFYSTKFTGRGMGLSVVLGIVKSHNGGITVESQPDRGSIFRVFFPLSTEEILRQPDKPIQPLDIQGGGTVLLIEDEPQVRNMANIMLTRLGYTVLEAKDGIEALEIFKQHKNEIRCVLSDLTMPRMNGWDTLAALRKLSPDIPVILCSGYDEAQVMADEHQERPNAFLGKPYRLQDLKDTIRHALADKKKTSHRYEPL